MESSTEHDGNLWEWNYLTNKRLLIFLLFCLTSCPPHVILKHKQEDTNNLLNSNFISSLSLEN